MVSDRTIISVDNDETSPIEENASRWERFKKWSLSTATSKPGRWALSLAQSGGGGVFVNSVLDFVFPDYVFFTILNYTLSAITVAGLTRYNSHDMSARIEKDALEKLRNELQDLKIANIVSTLNANIALVNQANPASPQQDTIDFDTDPLIQAKEAEIEDAIKAAEAANKTSCLRIRKLLSNSGSAESQNNQQRAFSPSEGRHIRSSTSGSSSYYSTQMTVPHAQHNAVGEYGDDAQLSPDQMLSLSLKGLTISDKTQPTSPLYSSPSPLSSSRYSLTNDGQTPRADVTYTDIDDELDYEEEDQTSTSEVSPHTSPRHSF